MPVRLTLAFAALAALPVQYAFSQDPKSPSVQPSGAPLRNAIIAKAGGADSVRLEWYEFVGDDPQSKSRSKDVVDAKEVAALLAALQFDEKRGAVRTDAEFPTKVILRRGGKSVANLRFEGPYLLRWTGGDWKGDAILTADAGRNVCQWLARHGLPGWERERLARERQRASDLRRFDGMLAAFPKDCAETLRKPLRPRRPFHEGEDDDVKGHADELAKKVGSPDKLAACVFRVYGADDRDPGWYDIYDLLMRNLMRRCSAADFRAALESVKDDRRALAGAARFGLEDRYGDLPEGSRDEWTVRLATALLAEGSPGGKRRAVAVLGGQRRDDARKALRQTLSAPSPSEAKDGDESADVEPSLKAAAGFWLGALKDEPSIPGLRAALSASKTEPDKTVFRLALQIAGAEPLVLRPADFNTKSTFVAEAVARCAVRKGGNEGMEFLVTHGLGAGPWFINAAAAQGVRVLASRSFADGPPPPTGDRDFDALAKWWRQHPARKASATPSGKSGTGDASGSN